jgi:hypothetical protein
MRTKKVSSNLSFSNNSWSIKSDSWIGVIYLNRKNKQLNTLGFVKLSGNKWKKVDQDKAIIKHYGHGFTILIRFLDLVFFRFHVSPLKAKFRPALNFKFNPKKNIAFVESPILSVEQSECEEGDPTDLFSDHEAEGELKNMDIAVAKTLIENIDRDYESEEDENYETGSKDDKSDIIAQK